MANVTKCPVCEGRGIVKPEFYYEPAEKGPLKCRACDGRGVFRDTPFYTNPPISPYTYPNPYLPLPTWWTVTSGTSTSLSREKPNEITVTSADVRPSFGAIGD